MVIEEGALIGGTHVYVPAKFDPAKYDLTKTETRTLLSLVPALESIDSLYFIQKGGERNLKTWKTLSRVAASTSNPNIIGYHRQMSIYGWLFDRSGRKIKPGFSEGEWSENLRKMRYHSSIEPELYQQFCMEETAPKGANVFVNDTGMDDEEFAKTAARVFNEEFGKLSEVERSARVHQLLNLGTRVVVRAKPGKPDSVISRHESWTTYRSTRGFVMSAAESFWEAGDVCEQELPRYSVLLKATGRGMHTSNFDARDVLLYENDSRMYTFGGIGEEYIGAALGWDFSKKGSYDLVIGVKNPELTPVVGKFVKVLPKMIETLPVGLRNKVSAPPKIDAIDVAFIAGESNHFGFTLGGRNWPNDMLLNSLYPYIVFHVVESGKRTKYLVKPAIEALLPEDKIPDSDEKISNHMMSFLGLHEDGHSVGERKIHHDALEEGKATACGIANYPIYDDNQKSVEEFCWVAAVNLVRSVRAGSDVKTGKVVGAHAIGENVILDKMFANGAAKVEDDKLEINPQAMIRTAKEYSVDAVGLIHDASQEAIDSYLQPYRTMDENLRTIMGRLNNLNLPIGFYMDRGTIGEFKKRLAAHLKSLG